MESTPDGRAGWSEMAEFYDRTRAFPGDGDRRVPAAVAACLVARGARRVLDVGCGTGRFAVPLAGAGLDVFGIDRSPEMLSHLVVKPGADRVRVVRADVEKMPFRRAFDAAMFSHLLHLLSSLEPLAEQLRHVLREGAHVLVVDTSSGPRPATNRVLAAVMPHLGEEFHAWPHGEDSRDRRLTAELARRIGAGTVEVVPCAEFAAQTTLREVIADIRARKWWTFRRRDADACIRAADAAERQLAAEGADLDEKLEEPVVIRFLVASLPRSPG